MTNGSNEPPRWVKVSCGVIFFLFLIFLVVLLIKGIEWAWNL
ncbi:MULTISPECIES: hypothetical protein [Streptomyces]